MIQKIRLLHYLNKSTYEKICNKLNFNESGQNTKDNIISYKNQKIDRVSLFNILYEQIGYIWFMYIDINFPLFNCDYTVFADKLYDEYTRLFGVEIMSEFPKYNELNCDYIEYTATISVNNADEIIEELKKGRCVPEQLDRSLWNEFKKPHGTIEFCIDKNDDKHLDILSRLHGTALKKRIKNLNYHRATGVTPVIAVHAETQKEILLWCMHMHNIHEYILHENNSKKHKVLKNNINDVISVISSENTHIASKFISLAGKLNLKSIIRYAVGHKTWKCIFSMTKIKRVLFTLECNENRFIVKANLFHIDNYLDKTNDITPTIISKLNIAYNCNECNPICRKGASLTLDGKTKRKCITSAFTFENLKADEWQTVIKMVEEEAEIKAAI